MIIILKSLLITLLIFVCGAFIQYLINKAVHEK